MSREAAYLMGIHQHSFRPYEIAVIRGVVMFAAPNSRPSRPCFHVTYPDGVEDFVPVSESSGACEVGSFATLSAIAGHEGPAGEGL